MWKPDLVLCGPGGAKSMLFLGSIKCLLANNFLTEVTEWVGISAGAAISLLIVAGITIDQIIEVCLELNMAEDLSTIDLNDARIKMGLIKNKGVEDKLKSLLASKFGKIPTLLELYNATGLGLHLVTFNLDKMKPEYLSKDTEPNLSCLEAAMMSMAIPLLIQPRKYKGHIYLDGAIGAPYPVLKFDKDGKKILGLYISSEQDLFCPDKKPLNFMYRLIQSGMKSLRDNQIEFCSENVKHIALHTTVRDTTGISLNREMRLDLVDQGYKAAETFLTINSNPEKYKIKLEQDEEIQFEEEVEEEFEEHDEEHEEAEFEEQDEKQEEVEFEDEEFEEHGK